MFVAVVVMIAVVVRGRLPRLQPHPPPPAAGRRVTARVAVSPAPRPPRAYAQRSGGLSLGVGFERTREGLQPPMPTAARTTTAATAAATPRTAPGCRGGGRTHHRPTSFSTPYVSMPSPCPTDKTPPRFCVVRDARPPPTSSTTAAAATAAAVPLPRSPPGGGGRRETTAQRTSGETGTRKRGALRRRTAAAAGSAKAECVGGGVHPPRRLQEGGGWGIGKTVASQDKRKRG